MPKGKCLRCNQQIILKKNGTPDKRYKHKCKSKKTYLQETKENAFKIWKDLKKNRKYLLFFVIILIIGSYLTVFNLPLISSFTLAQYTPQDLNTTLTFSDQNVIINYDLQETTESYLGATIYGTEQQKFNANITINNQARDRNINIFQGQAHIFSQKTEEGHKQISLNICKNNSECKNFSYSAFVYSEEQKEVREKFNLIVFLVAFIVITSLFYFNLNAFKQEATKSFLSTIAILVPFGIILILGNFSNSISAIIKNFPPLAAPMSWFILSVPVMLSVAFINFIRRLFKEHDKNSKKAMMLFIFILALIVWPVLMTFPFFAYLILIIIAATYVFFFVKKENKNKYFPVFATLIGVLFAVTFIHPMISPIIINYSEHNIIDMGNYSTGPYAKTFVDADVNPAFFDYPFGNNSIRMNLPDKAYISYFGDTCATFRFPEKNSIRILFQNNTSTCNIKLNYTHSSKWTTNSLLGYVTTFSEEYNTKRDFYFGESKVQIRIIQINYHGELEIHNYPLSVPNDGDSIYFLNGKIGKPPIKENLTKHLLIDLIPNKDLTIIEIPNNAFNDSNIQKEIIEVVESLN